MLRKLIRKLILVPLGYGRPAEAKVFDREFERGAWAHFKTLPEQGRQLLVAGLVHQLKPGAAVLEVGCGDGHLAAMLAAKPLARYVGVDLSEVALTAARQRALPGAEFIVGNFETWGTAERFDVILFTESLGYADDPGAVVARFLAFLTPGGFAIVSHFRSGNWETLWGRIERQASVVEAFTLTNSRQQTWDIKVLQPNAG
jgi:SAM-dependent methyltransferase